jgi:hypothetical protein
VRKSGGTTDDEPQGGRAARWTVRFRDKRGFVEVDNEPLKGARMTNKDADEEVAPFPESLGFRYAI